jgi:hypothetical protein
VLTAPVSALPAGTASISIRGKCGDFDILPEAHAKHPTQRGVGGDCDCSATDCQASKCRNCKRKDSCTGFRNSNRRKGSCSGCAQKPSGYQRAAPKDKAKD